MYLVKFFDNLSDEMDIVGFKTFTIKEWEEYKTNAEEVLLKGWSFFIGPNEEIEYETFDNFMKTFQVIEITVEQYEILNHFFIPKKYSGNLGFFPMPE